MGTAIKPLWFLPMVCRILVFSNCLKKKSKMKLLKTTPTKISINPFSVYLRYKAFLFMIVKNPLNKDLMILPF